MSFDPLSAALGLGKIAVERLWPDPIQRATEMRKLEELYQKGDMAQLDAHVQLMLGQIEINKIEAGSKSLFVAGWRPAVGWAGVLALTYSGVVYPLLLWVWSILAATGHIPQDVEAPPFIAAGVLGTIVTGMLGIGTMRSVDKKNGAATDKLR